MPAEVYTATEKHHAFVFQQLPLLLAGCSGERDFPLSVEDAVPGDIRPGGNVVKCVSC
jgi:hypothetical protein